MPEFVEVTPPFRWDMISPDQLGSLLACATEPDLWFLDDLVDAAGKVLARGGNGDLYFVGRSLDSMFDLLSGALADVPAETRLARVPFSFQRPVVALTSRRWRPAPLSPGQRVAARQLLASNGLTPHALARRARPATFVDLVNGGRTFTELFDLLDDWIVESRQQWDVIRRKLRFVGVTVREKTSPKTWRWQQHYPWTRRLPAGAIKNVSLDRHVWSYFGNYQTKLTRSFRPDRWLDAADGPSRDENAMQALAEAVALVQHGRTPAARQALARVMSAEPAFAQPWLRTLVRTLNG